MRPQSSQILVLTWLVLLSGCALLPPIMVAGRVASASLSGATFLVDRLVVRPVLALPRAVPAAHRMNRSLLEPPRAGLRKGLPEPLPTLLITPFYLAGMTVSIPIGMAWFAVVPGSPAPKAPPPSPSPSPEFSQSSMAKAADRHGRAATPPRGPAPRPG